jgi:superfamily II DNA or RNA helicase
MKEDLAPQGNGQTLADMIHLPGISIRPPFAFRTGQLHFLHKLSSRLLQNDNYHLGVFVPGYGKTITALASFVIARHLKKAHKLIVFVPRGNLRDQYADAKELSSVLRNLGAPPLTFCTADSDKTFLKNASTDIIITTYQYASGKTGNAALQAFASKEKCMFVFDEVHHLSDEGTWAKAINNLPHTCSVALSGTPVRSDNKALFGVPFEIKNDERFYSALHEVLLRDAHEEGKILKRVSVNMIDYKIKLRNIDTQEEVELSLGQMQEMASGEKDVDAFLARRNMRFHTVYLESLLKPAFERFKEKRNAMVDHQLHSNSRKIRAHQMLIIAMSNLHAKAILEFVQERFPEWSSARIGQDIPEKTRLATLDQYRKGEIDVMVQVDMIGEGTDIKPISVIVKADLVRAFSKTMQQIFRGMRYFDGFSHEQNICDLFASNDSALAAIFEWLMNEQQIGVKLQQKRLDLEHNREHIQEQESWILADVEHKATETLHWELFPDPNKPNEPEIPSKESSTGIDSEQIMAMNVIELEQQLRQECANLAYRLTQSLKSQGLKADIRTIHSASKKRFGKSQDDMNLRELESKKEWLFQCLERGRIF